MASDLISRAAAIAEVEQWAEHGYDTIHWTGIKAMLEVQPAVDAAPVVHGQWKSVKANASNNYPFWNSKCSVCGYTTAMTQTGWFYCPHCGAKMDGRETDE